MRGENRREKKPTNSGSTQYAFCAFVAVVAGLLVGFCYQDSLVLSAVTTTQSKIEPTDDEPTDDEPAKAKSKGKTLQKANLDANVDADVLAENSEDWVQHGLHTLPCAPRKKFGSDICNPSTCGSAVFDDFITAEEVRQLNDLMDLGMSMGSGGAGPPSILDLVSGAVSEGTQFVSCHRVMQHKGISFNEKHLLLYKNVTERIKLKIEETFGCKNLMLTNPTFFSKISGEKEAQNIHDEYWHPHVDTIQYPSFVYTSLLYLNDQDSDYSGGKFIFDHQQVSKRRSVTPQRGRLSVFTSGEENLHHVARVRSGERRAVTIAFTCDERDAIKNFLDDLL